MEARNQDKLPKYNGHVQLTRCSFISTLSEGQAVMVTSTMKLRSTINLKRGSACCKMLSLSHVHPDQEGNGR
jgi:hypothetical protein